MDKIASLLLGVAVTSLVCLIIILVRFPQPELMHWLKAGLLATFLYSATGRVLIKFKVIK